jgi:fructosamine-3-kinase
VTALAALAARLLGRPAASLGAVGGGSICHAERLRLADGRTVLAKTLGDAPAGFFAAEAAGLAWLRSTGAVAVPDVPAADERVIVLEWIEPGDPTPAQAERLGRDLAALHSVPAEAYGTPYPAFIGSLPLPSAQRHAATSPVDWPGFHAEHRLLPFLRQATDNGSVTPADAKVVERLCERLPQVGGASQRPAVIHGDLWSGNVLWAADGRARLIDPATQGGHPEADLAMLELFGCPRLPRILAAYEEVRPVPGRRDRVPLHQLHPLLVHAALFGGSYGPAAVRAARAALSGGR